MMHLRDYQLSFLFPASNLMHLRYVKSLVSAFVSVAAYLLVLSVVAESMHFRRLQDRCIPA